MLKSSDLKNITMEIKLLLPRSLKRRIKSELVLCNNVLIGSHHKAGTVWMQTIFRDIAKKYRLHMESRNLGDLPPDSYDIYFHSHSDFDFSKIKNRYKGMHIIRDPRDLIVSATHYHVKSDESWLHIKRPEFGNMTYHEKINTYSTFGDQMLFEMENSSAREIRSIMNWDYTDKRFLNVHYEELMQDNRLELFERIFRHLGFREWHIGWCLMIAYRNSLFSGGVKSQHVRSGKSRQWPEYFKPPHKKRFNELFGDVLVLSGYLTGQDDDWDSL